MTNFGSLFEACGKFYLPGKEPLGNPLSPITPPSYDPTGTGEVDPILGEIPPPVGDPLYKCEELFIPCPSPNGNITERIIRTCVQCLNPDGTPLLSLVTRPAGNEECRFREPTCDDDPTASPCLTTVFNCPGEPQKYKCVETIEYCPPGSKATGTGVGNVPRVAPPADLGREIKQIKRECIACAPGSRDPECKYDEPSCSPDCNDGTLRQCVRGPFTGGPNSSGPTTGAGFKCVTTKEFCPPGSLHEGRFIRIRTRECKTCNRGAIPPIGGGRSFPGSFTPQTATKPTIVVPSRTVEETPCQYPNNLATCVAACPPINATGPITQLVAFCNSEPSILSTRPTTGGNGGIPSGRLPVLNQAPVIPQGGGGIPTGRLPLLNQAPNNPQGGGGIPSGRLPVLNQAPNNLQGEGGVPLGRYPVLPQANSGISDPGPLQSVSLPAQQLQQIQEKNATFINTNEKAIREDNQELKNNVFNQHLYHPELNLFKSTPDDTITLVPNNSYPEIFSDQIDSTISRVLLLANTSSTWNEKDFINLTREKIIASLNSDLLISFKIIRFPGGEVVGLNTFVDMLKKHLVTGTISKFDPSFYVEVGKAQLQQNFTLLEPAAAEEYAARFSIDYIVNNGESLLENKASEAQNIQVNRGRVLNEDLDLKINVDTILSSTTLTVPNEGILLSSLSLGGDASPTTPVSVGQSDRLNTGDGGGYYFYVSGVEGTTPLKTSNLLDTSYYLPDFKKSKVLSLNGKSFVATLEASSLSDKHEFVSGDAGASSFEPMYFGINLSSVSSSYGSDPLIENYTASYSRIVDTDQIARHVNNNAQSLSEFRIGYDDPLYRYILDTSSLKLTQEDLTMYGFKEGYSSVNFNFPKNIPFAIIILPVAGSKFNPLNAQSTLVSFKGDTFVRTLDFKPSIGEFIDKTKGTSLSRYNLYNRDGSTKIGLSEKGSVQSFGYTYEPSAYSNTLYDGTSYTSSIEAVSSFGIAYLMTEVLDYIAENTTSKTITWFDIYRRMPFNRFSELFYTSPEGIFDDIKEGFRKGLRPDFILKGIGDQEALLLPKDSRTIIEVRDRQDTSRVSLDG